MEQGRAANGRSSIYQGADGRWHGYVSMGVGRDGRPVRRHVTARTQAEVTRKVRVLEEQRQKGGVPAAGRRPTLGAYLEEWIDRRAGLDVRPSTVVGYKVDAKHVGETIGSLRIDRVTAAHVESLWSRMVIEGRVGSIAHIKRTLGACFADAIRDGLISRNPARLARVPRYDAPEVNPYDADDVRIFLAVSVGRRNAPRWLLGAVLGLRQGEVLGLQWPDFAVDQQALAVRRQLRRNVWQHGCSDPSACRRRGADCPHRLGGGLLTSEPKSRAGRRTVSLPGPVVTALVEHRKAQLAERLAAPYWEEGDWIFTNPWGGPIDPRRDWSEFKSIIGQAGLRDVRLHDLRHAAATLMLESEIDLRTAGQLLGHGSVSQTQHYSHVLADRKRVAADRLGAFVWPPAAAQ